MTPDIDLIRILLANFFGDFFFLPRRGKTLFRFGEIKDPHRREETKYILIGSLISIGLAMLTGIVVRAWTGR